VVFASGFGIKSIPPIKQVTVGAGGGPHHRGSLTIVRSLASQGAAVRIVSVTSTGKGTAEDPTETADAFEEFDIDIAEVEAATIADGLVDAAAVDGGVLVIGASRDRRLSQWVFGSTPDRVVDRAEAAEVPVLVYATSGGITGRIEDYLFPVYRYLRARLRRDDTAQSGSPASEQGR
jgi:APA family basic amino acid/polyamine antiporter